MALYSKNINLHTAFIFIHYEWKTQIEKFVIFGKKGLMQNLCIIAGCNGAGKTVASYTIRPDMLDCKEFINADEIARGLSPF